MPAETKLHIGCGRNILPGWINLDITPHDGVDIVDDARKLLKVQDQSCDRIYACHILEHVGRHEVDEVLRVWHAKLKPGGILRLSVPDFEKAVEWYRKGGIMKEILGFLVGGQRDRYDYHGVVFDRRSLTESLQRAGFASVRPWNWRQTDHTSFDDYSQAYLPHMDKEQGMLMSLNLEAVK